MFRKNRTNEATIEVQVQDVTSRTGRQLREKVVPVIGAKAHGAKSWAAPRVERGMEAAAPRVEAAVDRVSPAVDATRDKIVEDLLPRLVDAVHAAAAAGATAGAASQVARSRGQDAYSVLRGDAQVKHSRGGGKRKLLLALTALAAAIGAAVAAFKKQAPQEDPWAVPAGTYSSPATSTSPTTSSSSDDLASGQAQRAMDNGSSAEVPGLSVDSAAAQDAISGAAKPASGTTPTPEALRKTTKKPADSLDKPQSADKS